MPKTLQNQDSDLQLTDRRAHVRIHLKSLAYVEIDQGNGGLILNICERGMAVQSAQIVVGDDFERMRFRLPKSEKWIETRGKLAWVGKSRKEAGIEFLDLNSDAQQQIRTWVHSAKLDPSLPAEPGRFQVVWEAEKPTTHHAEPAKESEAGEFDSTFPSEKSLSPAKFPGLNKPTSRDPAPPRAENRLKDAPVRHSLVRSYELPLARPVTRAEQRIEEVQQLSRAIGEHRDRNKERAQRIERRPQESEWRSAETANLEGTPPIPDARGDRDARSLRAAFAPAERAAADSRAATFSPKPVGADAPLPTPISFTGFEYQPPAFEEPSGKGWLLAGAILVALLGFGAALAIGPANVKTLVSRYLAPHFSSTEGPRPQANVSEGTPSIAPDTSRIGNDPIPVERSAKPLLNPGIAADARGEGPAASVPAPSVTNRGKAYDGGLVASRATVGINAPDSLETPETAEAKTRQFQMEHEQRVLPPVPYGGTSRQPPLPSSATESSTATAPSDRTMDAYALGAIAPTVGNAASPAGATTLRSQAPAIPYGTVAISSHFGSIRTESREPRPKATLQVGQLMWFHQPDYPTEAARAHVEGIVQLQAIVDPSGRVEVLHVVSGPPMLVPAAIDAVRQWRYGATILDGRTVESVNDVSVVFRLANSTPSPR
jgi:outer membrane biosynthesis protein TonB